MVSNISFRCFGWNAHFPENCCHYSTVNPANWLFQQMVKTSDDNHATGNWNISSIYGGWFWPTQIRLPIA